MDQLVGPLLFISFIILGSLFLLNVFIAILSEAYEKAKIQVFGDAFDEHDEFWLAMLPTSNIHHQQITSTAHSMQSMHAEKECCSHVFCDTCH